MLLLLFFTTILAIASVYKVLAGGRDRGDVPFQEIPIPRVAIDNLEVPTHIRPGSADAILNCDYGDPEDKLGLTVRWFYDNTDDPGDLWFPRKKDLVYEWIPPQWPQAFGILKDKVDLMHKATANVFTEHRALRILSPEPDMSGNYTCEVSTAHSKDEQTKTMTISGVPLAFPLSSTKLFRQGYKYNRVTDAFYKLHTLPVPPWTAFQKCLSEGGTLLVPSNEEDIKQLRMLMEPLHIQQVLIGDGNRIIDESSEEVAVICIKLYTEGEDVIRKVFYDKVYRFGMVRRRPFVCKVEAKIVTFDEHCDTGYEYYDNIKSCYKLFNYLIDWDSANSECEKQGAHLLVLNSKAESNTIKEYLSTRQHSKYINVGIRKVERTRPWRGVFKTVFNETLETAGFSQWSPGEPSNWSANENCGSINENATYNDTPCHFNANYLCEKELHLGPKPRKLHTTELVMDGSH